MKIAIQGELGAFSHEAALRMVPHCTPVACSRSTEAIPEVLWLTYGSPSQPDRTTSAS